MTHDWQPGRIVGGGAVVHAGLDIATAYSAETGAWVVLMRLGERWIVPLTPDQAAELAASLIEHASLAQGAAARTRDDRDPTGGHLGDLDG